MKKHNIKTQNKGQAALEFLTTYGWAFLVILVMIGALSYFGVLDPSKFLPDKCIFGSGIGACVDSVASDSRNEIDAIVINSIGKDIKVNDVNITVQGLAAPCTPDCSAAPNCGITYGTVWTNNDKRTINISMCTLSAGDKPKAHVMLTYQEVGGTYNHVIEGDVQVKLSP
jgi:hypothetical protein